MLAIGVGMSFQMSFPHEKLQGYNVMQPMGWDAFALPAENAAIKKGICRKNNGTNIANFKKQLKEIGALYDWEKELSTTDPDIL